MFLISWWVLYVQWTWITNRNWPIASWCQHYRKLITNNDKEGWHTRLNVHCGRRQHGNGLPLYMLIDVSAKEAQLIKLYEKMLIQHHTLRIKRKTYVLLNTKLFSLWDDHQNNYVWTLKVFLSNCAKLYTDCYSFKFKKTPMIPVNVNWKSNLCNEKVNMVQFVKI